MLRATLLWQLLFALLLGATSSLSVAEELPPELIELWEADWHARTNEMRDVTVTRLQEPLRGRTDPDTFARATEDFEGVVLSAIHWQVFSATVIDAISASCDADVLARVGSYVRDEVDESEFDPDTVREYSICYYDAILDAESAAAYAIMAKAVEMQSTLARYQSASEGYRRIAPEITTAAVDAEFRTLIDDITGLHAIQDVDAQQRAIDELRRRLRALTVVYSVNLEDPGYTHSVFNQLFSYDSGREVAENMSCYGGSLPPEQRGLMRCSPDSGARVEHDLLNYRSYFDYEGERLEIMVTFFYGELLELLTQ